MSLKEGYLYLTPETIFTEKLFGTSLAKCNISPNYYKIFRPELFYPLAEANLSGKVFNI